ncbi:multiheme c-type cytochrome [Microbulbifer sp. SSSA007]|uniref:multiheme c-type cytochrome n=1 Tax=Microbulbifer sp. SSSA007 TaxID=3243379 RepID=UPI0040391FAF
MINIVSGISRLVVLLSLQALIACGPNDRSMSKVDKVKNLDTSTTHNQQIDQAAHKETTYVGSKFCAHCHKEETSAWQSSHHAFAMQEANEGSILGDFNQSTFTYEGITSTFYKKKGDYYVNTDGANGELKDFPIAYTFGAVPLQQYLIQSPGGRLQALSIAWDSRSKAEGGQRWFHLYPDEKISHKHSLHWSGINQNWNFMCADCHSTKLQKNYDLNTDSFKTSWSEINVACESCHGSASKHLEWAENKQLKIKNFGFPVELHSVRATNWEMDHESGIAKNKVSKKNQELQTCAQCHSRRTTFFPGAKAGSQFLDHYNPALLLPPLYHIDGQINEEVYVYGSFLQSKMYAAGVTCSNCHEPHSLQLRSSSDGVCSQCHLPEKFAQVDHHLHPVNSSGARCVNCHMPSKNYMQVDSRRDHSFRIPRPDLSDKLNTPNACLSCHQEQTNQWATDVLRRKFGAPDKSHYGEALHAGFFQAIDGEKKLSQLITDSTQPAIARATAVTLLPQYFTRHSAQLLQAIAQGNEPLLSLALAQSLDRVPAQFRPALGIPLLFERERITRSLAANALGSLPLNNYPGPVQKQFYTALKEYTASELFNSDRPESLVNLGELHRQRGNSSQAEVFFRRAIKSAPYYVPAYVNLADLYRVEEREEEAEKLLRQGLNRAESKAAVQHSLGLSLIRQSRHSEAIYFLQQAAEAQETNSRYIYVYAIALHSAKEPLQALSVLEKGLDQFPSSPDILQAIISIHRESGNLEKAKKYEVLLTGNY